jgi:alpha/beta superfamily hydrolase
LNGQQDKEHVESLEEYLRIKQHNKEKEKKLADAGLLFSSRAQSIRDRLN